MDGRRAGDGETGGGERQVARIAYLEQQLDEALAGLCAMRGALDRYAGARRKLQELDAFLGSDEWQQALDDDEAGLLPPDLKRGVLSQDAVYDALTANHALAVRMLEEATESLR